MVTLTDLITSVRQRSDMEFSDFVTDPEITAYINNSASELYDILVSRFEDYYTLDPVPFTISSGNSYLLPADFYKLRGLDLSLGSGEFVNVRNFMFNERNNDSNAAKLSIVQCPQRYRVMGNKLIISPVDQAVGSYQLWYIPQCPKLVNPTDTLDTISGWEEYVIVDAAIKCLQKEESDVNVLLLQKQALIKRIESMAQNRDVDQPERITDVHATDYSGRGWR